VFVVRIHVGEPDRRLSEPEARVRFFFTAQRSSVQLQHEFTIAVLSLLEDKPNQLTAR
jgi:hypothetical protein